MFVERENVKLHWGVKLLAAETKNCVWIDCRIDVSRIYIFLFFFSRRTLQIYCCSDKDILFFFHILWLFVAYFNRFSFANKTVFIAAQNSSRWNVPIFLCFFIPIHSDDMFVSDSRLEMIRLYYSSNR